MNSGNFFAELKRRNVYKVAVAYAIVAWLLIQVATQVFPFFEIPNWAVRLVVLLVILGFPIALFLAWAFEITPEGIKRAEDVDLNQSITKHTGRKLIWTTVVLAVIAAGLLAFQLLRPKSAVAPRQNEAATGSAPASNALPEKSIAVLPFENLSRDPDNAFFTDGVQDEILTNLARVADLKVISRTSVMQYKSGVQRNLREIAQQLGVAHLLEGSVQRAGGKVRVNAQLIDARTDGHQWAQSFDRDIADVFAIQSEIAKAIADQLRAKLSPTEKQRVEEIPTANTEAYVYYLRGNQIELNPDTLLEDYNTAEGLFVQAIKLDPNFALAHARLASIQAEIFHYYEPTDSRRTKARTEAETALRLEPNLAEAHFALGQCIYWIDRDYQRALEQFELASRLSPSNGDARRLIAAIKRREGKWEEALEAYERVAELDPQNPNTVREVLFTNT